MKTILPLIVVFLVGCVGNADSTSTESSGGGASPSSEYYFPPNSGVNHGACWGGSTVETIVIDGVTYSIEIPALCNPYWHDTGDPPPDERRQVDDSIDPNPVDVIVQPETIQQAGP